MHHIVPAKLVVSLLKSKKYKIVGQPQVHIGVLCVLEFVRFRDRTTTTETTLEVETLGAFGHLYRWLMAIETIGGSVKFSDSSPTGQFFCFGSLTRRMVQRFHILPNTKVNCTLVSRFLNLKAAAGSN